MADELQGSASWTLTKNGSTDSWTSGGIQIDVAGNNYTRAVVAVTSGAPQEISMGGVAGNGRLHCLNLAAISINVGVTTPFQISMKPDEDVCMRMIGTKFYAQASGTSATAVYLETFFIDD